MKMLQRYIGDQMVVCEMEQINAEGKGRWFGVWDGEPQDTRAFLTQADVERQRPKWAGEGLAVPWFQEQRGYSDQRSKQGEDLGVKGAVALGSDLGPCGQCKDRLLGGGSGAVRVWAEERLINQSTLSCCVEKRLEGTRSVPRVRDRMTVAQTGVVVGRWEK